MISLVANHSEIQSRAVAEIEQIAVRLADRNTRIGNPIGIRTSHPPAGLRSELALPFRPTAA